MSQAVLKPELGNEKPETGLSQDARREIAEKLSAILTDTYFLVIKSHVYHWNVVGPLFRSVHLLTEEHYTNLFDAADEIDLLVRRRREGLQLEVTAGLREFAHAAE